MNDINRTLNDITIRFKFNKTGVFKYLSHLDILTILLRAVSRSAVRVKFSAGFNPKPKLLLSNPIPLGVESHAEYCDIELAEDIDVRKFKNIMNQNLPKLLKISDALKINKKIRHIMAQIDLVGYEFEIKPTDTGRSSQTLPEILSQILSGKGSCPASPAGSIYMYEVLAGKDNIFLLKILGYAKILNGDGKSVFKFNDFFRWLAESGVNYNFMILSSRKSEVYIMTPDGMLTPLEAMF